VSGDDKPKRVPILVGDDFDDDEATALDLSADAYRAAVQARAQDASDPPASAPSLTDNDASPAKTEVLLERPEFETVHKETSGSRVVPLGDGAARLIGSGSGPNAVWDDEDDDDDRTLQLTRPVFEHGRAVPDRPLPKVRNVPIPGEDETAPLVRPLDAMHLDINDDLADDNTLSRPKIQRMTFRPEPPSRGRGPENTDTKKRAATPSASPPPDLDDEKPGRLVIEAPADATVFVDGVERGGGTVTIDDVHRHRRLAVRVHRAGCRPWSRAVSLGGRDEVRVTATPDPK
jgi:hypothetical protein